MPTDTRPKVRRFRWLRIAWSVWWGVVTVLLIVLWVRSYGNWFAAYKASNGHTLLVGSSDGDLRFSRQPGLLTQRPRWFRLDDGEPSLDRPPASYWGSGFFWRSSPNLFLRLPHWIAVLVAGIASALPWGGQLRWRFSLRTLLIATTLVAVALGLIVWASR